MSLFDYIDRDVTVRKATVRLRLRLSTHRKLVLFALLGIFIFLVLISSLAVSDPHWHPKHVHGKSSGIILLLMVLPAFWRIFALWSFGGFAIFGLVTRVMRLGDKKSDYLVGRDGIADVGLLYSRLIAWKYIDHIELRKQRHVAFALIKPDAGAQVEIFEKFRGISQLHVFNKGNITIPLTW